MSIIYEALKKAEIKSVKKGTNNKKKFFLGIIFALIVIIGFSFFIKIKQKPPTSLPLNVNKKHKKKVPFKEKKYPQNELLLEGIVYDKGKPLAIINGKVFKEGDKINKLEIKKIDNNSVQLIDSQGDRTITLTF